MAEIVKRFRTSAMASSPGGSQPSLPAKVCQRSRTERCAVCSSSDGALEEGGTYRVRCGVNLCKVRQPRHGGQLCGIGRAGCARHPAARGCVRTGTCADLFGLCRSNRLIYSHWLVWLGGGTRGYNRASCSYRSPCVSCVSRLPGVFTAGVPVENHAQLISSAILFLNRAERGVCTDRYVHRSPILKVL